MGGDDAEGDTSAPAQPTEMTFGTAGSAGRFQVFARVSSTTRHIGVTFKSDLDDAEPRAQSWVPVYPGADWHEREAWEMFGIDFDGHPAMRNLYLPSEFEGHPLRKDYPLLAREVKPWPGLVNVEGMPGEEPAVRKKNEHRHRATSRRRPSSRSTWPTPASTSSWKPRGWSSTSGRSTPPPTARCAWWSNSTASGSWPPTRSSATCTAATRS